MDRRIGKRSGRKPIISPARLRHLLRSVRCRGIGRTDLTALPNTALQSESDEQDDRDPTNRS
jgi:hypothetical protein